MPKAPVEVEKAFARLERARALYAEHYNQNVKVIDVADKLRDKIAEAIGEAKALYQQHKDVIGPHYQGFSISKKRHVDAELLVELMPDAHGLVKLSIAVKDFERYVKDGTIPDDIAEQVEGYVESVTGPRQ